MKKLAVIFPGIGYTCDKPLLYYSWKLLKTSGYEIIPVSYSGFPDGVKGNAEKMHLAAIMALEQSERILKSINWDEYEDIVFVSKSVGTVVGSAYARQHHIACRHVLFTPVEETFQFADREAIVFHGTGDPWAETTAIEEQCRALGITLYETENANHSLEIGNVDADIDTMKKTMRIVREYIQNHLPCPHP